jgi:dTMP kinase
VPVDVALERLALRRGGAAPDRFEAENVEFHEKLREAFRALTADEPERCFIIDASVPRVQVAKDIWDTVQAKLEPATAPLAQDVPAPETLVS